MNYEEKISYNKRLQDLKNQQDAQMILLRQGKAKKDSLKM
jgi:hypothetical protein